MNILLLGGTGAMGSHLSELLSSDPDNIVTVTSRTKREDHGNIRYLAGDAHDPGFIGSLLRTRWDVVVDFMVYNTEEFDGRVTTLLEATKQYVYLSSSRVYAYSKSPLREDSGRLLDSSEDSDYLATDEYALTKARQENILTSHRLQNWTIIRPYITYAENRLQLGVMELKEWLPRAVDGKSIVFSKDIAAKRTTLTYGMDVAKGIASIIGNPKALGRKFHITYRKSILWSEVLDIYLDAIEEFTGKRPKVRLIDKCPNLRSGNGKFQVMYDRYYDRAFDSSAISEFCPVDKFVEPRIGLRKCVESYIRNAGTYLEEADAYTMARYDRLAGEYCPLKRFRSYKGKLKYVLCRHFPSTLKLLQTIHK